MMFLSSPNIDLSVNIININGIQMDARRLFRRHVAQFAVQIPHFCHRITKKQNKSTATREMPLGRIHSQKLAQKFLDSPDSRFENLFRLPKYTFWELLLWLEEKEELEHTTHFTAEHQLLIFLWILAHASTYTRAATTFGVSTTTIHRVFKKLLRMFLSLHRHWVRQPDDDWLDPYIELSKLRNSFNGCIGAVDGTYVFMTIPANKQRPYRDRKGNLTQNIFTGIGFDTTFYFVLASAAGLVSDASL